VSRAGSFTEPIVVMGWVTVRAENSCSGGVAVAGGRVVEENDPAMSPLLAMMRP
jgi:hypothetical protein